MFRRETHRRVLDVLGSLQAETLSSCRVLFGGGTRIVLELEEYRESEDIDFLCSDPEGYAEIRFAAATRGFGALFLEEGLHRLRFPREMRIDQYGIRFVVLHGSHQIKLEILREARIGLSPGVRPSWSPVDCLSLPDCAAEKLLANADRWADRQVLSRDLIDLAVLRSATGPLPEGAWQKAVAAYRASAETDLRKALDLLQGDGAYRQRCFSGLCIEDPEPVLRGLEQIRGDLGSR